MVRLAASCCLLLLSTPHLARANETVRVEGDHFAVVVHFEDAALAETARADVERLWKPAAALYGLPQGALETKLVVHLYRDANDYQVAEEEITGGAFKRNLAFAHYDTKSAHVALQPDLSDDALAALDLPYLTRSMLLHEAAHLIRFHAMPNHRSHPDWFADGAAMWLKHHVLAGEKIDEVPLSATVSVRVQALLEKGELPSVAAILGNDIHDLGFYDRYSVCALFFRFLHTEHPKVLTDVARGVRRLGGGGGFAGRAADLLAEQLGSRGFAALDSGFRTFLRALRPAWEEIHRSLGARSRERAQIAFPSTNAIAWRTEAVGRNVYEIRATVVIFPNSAHQLNLLLDRRGNDFVCVALSGGYGVTLFEYVAADDRWIRIGSAKHEGVVVGKPMDVRAKVDGKRLAVTINGDEVVSATFPDRGMTGPYGLGALAGSAGIWRDVTLR